MVKLRNLIGSLMGSGAAVLLIVGCDLVVRRFWVGAEGQDVESWAVARIAVDVGVASVLGLGILAMVVDESAARREAGAFLIRGSALRVAK